MPEETMTTRTTFKNKVTERLSLHPNQWTGEDSVEVVRILIVNLQDEKGNPIKPTNEEDDLIQLVSRPTHEIQMRVIRTIVENHGAKLDPASEALIKKVVSPTAFKIELAKAGKIQDTSASGLKDLLD